MVRCADYLVLALNLLVFICFCSCGNDTVTIGDHRLCIKLYRFYKVKPGINWGTLPGIITITLIITYLLAYLLTHLVKKQNLWLQLNCDQYLCEHNKLQGKGVYHCIPKPSAIE